LGCLLLFFREKPADEVASGLACGRVLFRSPGTEPARPWDWHRGGRCTLAPRCQPHGRAGSVPGTNHSTIPGHSGVARSPESLQIVTGTAPTVAGEGKTPGA